MHLRLFFMLMDFNCKYAVTLNNFFVLTVDTPVRTPPEREIICVTLKKDPKHGFGN